MNRPAVEAFQDAAAAADAAAARLAHALRGRGPRSLVVTGGSSPGAVYDRLSRLDLGWSTVTVTLSDDRWVEDSSPLSNARLVRERLLADLAAVASFLPLKGSGATPQADAEAAEPALAALSPFAAVLLGMGPDGHIASLFPGDPIAARALDLHRADLCVGVPVAGLEPFTPRVSLTLRALVDTAGVVLLISGDEKRRIVERALGDAAYDPPVAALLRQTRAPVEILWSP